MVEAFNPIEYQRQQVIKQFLGTEEQIFKKTRASLDALARGQAGSYNIGTPGFYNSVIKSGGRKLNPAEWGICTAKIDATVEAINYEKELKQEVRDHYETESRAKMMIGTIELEEKERKHIEGDEKEL